MGFEADYVAEWPDSRIERILQDCDPKYRKHLAIAIDRIRHELTIADQVGAALAVGSIDTEIKSQIERASDALDRFCSWSAQADAYNIYGGITDASDECLTALSIAAYELTKIARPLGGPDRTILVRILGAGEALHDRAERALVVANETQNKAEELILDLRAAGAESALHETSAYYLNQARMHERVSRYFLWSILALSTLLGFGGFALLLLYPPGVDAAETSTMQMIEFIRSALGRLVVLSAIGFGAAFSVRNYRANKHLETVNRTRYNALMTAQRFMVSVDDQVRSLVAAEVVRAVFAGGSSGFLDISDDSKGGESASALLTALLSIQGKG
jgi:hypothetical protein